MPMNNNSFGSYPSNWGNQPAMPSQTVMPRTQNTGYSPLNPAPPANIMMSKMVDDERQITPQDVTMDGRISLFMLSDLSCIIAKAWNSAGTIDTVRYVPEKPIQSQANPAQMDATFQTEVFSRLDKIEQALKNNRKPYYHKQKPTTPQKGGDSE